MIGITYEDEDWDTGRGRVLESSEWVCNTIVITH